MKLSRLYSNFDEVFNPVVFNDGLNVVLAKSQDPNNLGKDIHNLGKSTLAKVIDFCLLKKSGDFPWKIQVLSNFVFFLEVKIPSVGYLTIRRSVESHSKASFYMGENSSSDLNDLEEDKWTHWMLPFERAKNYFDGILEFRCLEEWDFRKPVGYALRTQGDYDNVFMLSKFRGTDSTWKPFCFEMLGLDGLSAIELYKLRSELGGLSDHIKYLEKQLGLVESKSEDELQELIQIQVDDIDSYELDIEELSSMIEEFDFEVPDTRSTEDLVDRIDEEISNLNSERYYSSLALKRVDDALGSLIKFNMNRIRKVFEDANIYFSDQLVKDYDDLKVFLEVISKERNASLNAEKVELEEKIQMIESRLGKLNEEKSKLIDSLRSLGTLDKFKRYNQVLIDKKAHLDELKISRDEMVFLSEKRQDVEAKAVALENVIAALKQNIKESRNDGKYGVVKSSFKEVVKAVLNANALLSVAINSNDNVEFKASLLNDKNKPTSAIDGHSYKKLLCIAFDIAVFTSRLDERFVHFVYHDGVFESLEDRKKIKLIEQVRFACDSGLQYIMTLIDTDLPADFEFEESEILFELHDKGAEGRLFKMERW